MTPLDQTIYGNGEDGGLLGNCWQACVASMLDVPLDQVPHFVQDSGENWYNDTRKFVVEHSGMDFGCFVPGFPHHTEPGNYVIGSGPSPRGDFLHAVILDGITGELVHDPHFSRDGLAGPVVDVIGFVDIQKEK